MKDLYQNTEIISNDKRKYKSLIIGTNIFFIFLCLIQLYHTFGTKGTSEFSYLWLIFALGAISVGLFILCAIKFLKISQLV